MRVCTLNVEDAKKINERESQEIRLYRHKFDGILNFKDEGLDNDTKSILRSCSWGKDYM